MLDQNRVLWDQLQIRRGMQALARAHELGGAGGFYALQAAIIACHARAATAGETDLACVARARAAVGRAGGPEAALAIVDRLTQEPALKNYHLLDSVRGDLLQKLG